MNKHKSNKIKKTHIQSGTCKWDRSPPLRILLRSHKSGTPDKYERDSKNINHTFTKLTHWGRVTHICVGNLTIVGSDNGLSPGRRQAITWTNVGIWLIGPLGTNFCEMLIEIHAFSFKKIHMKMSSGNWRPFCLGLNVLTMYITDKSTNGVVATPTPN